MVEQPEDKDLQLAEEEQELPLGIAERKKSGRLRTGFTTGTAATAATKAALYLLTEQKRVLEVDVTLPKGSIITIPVAWIKQSDSAATAGVVKDGGDDPDVTHGAEICSTVSFIETAGKILIDGGNGVGRVTKPGLGLEIGRPAINPTPRKMIEQAVYQAASNQLISKGVKVVISVPNGGELAKKTDNPRLGIVGGISILGTTGIVLPYSTASFAASIRQGIDVLLATHCDTAVLTTGSRSEDFAKAMLSLLPEQSFIQMGDFAGFSVLQCAKKKVPKVVIAGFIGKLSKIAMGVRQTHVAGSHVNLAFMAKLASECGASQELVEQIASANTARHVSEIVTRNRLNKYFDLICKKAHDELTSYSGSALQMSVVMFDFDGSVVGQYPIATE